MQRLYSATVELGLIDPRYRQSSLASLLNTTSQRVKNWETRGPSKEILLEIQSAHGINATWVETGKESMRTKVSEKTHDDAPQYGPLSLLANTQAEPTKAALTPADRWPLSEEDYRRFAALPPEAKGYAIAGFVAGIDAAEARYLGNANSA